MGLNSFIVDFNLEKAYCFISLLTTIKFSFGVSTIKLETSHLSSPDLVTRDHGGLKGKLVYFPLNPLQSPRDPLVTK